MAASVLYDTSIDYSQLVSQAGYYQFNKYPPNNGNSTVTTAATNTVESIFDIQPNVINFGKMMLEFRPTVTNGATGVMSAMHIDAPPIRSMTLRTRGGKAVAQIDEFNSFWKTCNNMIQPNDDYQNYVSNGGVSATGAYTSNSPVYYNQPCGQLTSFAPTGCAGGIYHGYKIGSTGAPTQYPLFRKNYYSQASYVTSDGRMEAGGAGIVVNGRLNFIKIPFSFLGVNKDLYFPEAMQLSVVWEPNQNWVWSHCSNVGTQGEGVENLTNSLSLETNTLAVANIQLVNLLVPIQQDVAIKQNIMAKVMSDGLNMTIPFVNFNRIPLGTSSSSAPNWKLSRSQGQRLLRVISCEMVTNNVYNLRNNMYNYGAGAQSTGPSLTTEYYTTINGERQQQENIIFLNNDWRYNGRFWKGTPMQTPAEFYSTVGTVHIDDFSSINNLLECPSKDLTVCGKSLDTELLWIKNINSKTATDTSEYIWAITQKTLRIGKDGVDVV